MASQENSVDFQGLYKPKSPDVTVSDYALFANSKETFNGQRLSKAMEFKIEQEILLHPYKKVPACPANMIKRLEFAKSLLRFQKD